MPAGRAGDPSHNSCLAHGKSPAAGSDMQPVASAAIAAPTTRARMREADRVLEEHHIVLLHRRLLPVGQNVGHNEILLAHNLTELDACDEFACS